MWSSADQPTRPSAIDQVAAILDPVLTALGFAPGQGGASERDAQVIFCRGLVDSTDDGCVDLVVDLVVDGSVDSRPTPVWRIADVRYWGFPSERWHLRFDADADLSDQLIDLARTLPIDLG